MIAAARARVVRAACPHDCPDTCAMVVTVEDGRAVAVAGDPDHPITAGFLCGKVSNYLERVYAPDRVLHPLVREGEKGEGRFRPVSWDDALDLVAGRLREVIDRYGGEAILPYSFIGAQGALQYDAMSGRVMNALGATALDRTICDAAAMAGVALTHGESPEVDPEEWPHARYLLLWGWNPMSTAPHLWRLLLAARKAGAKLVVVDPYRSRTARVADEHLAPVPGTDGALALGLMRALVDAGLQDEAWCRAHATGYDELLERLGEYPVERCAAICGLEPETIRRVAGELATTQPSLIRLGVGGQHHAGAEIAYRTIACLPALTGSWRHRGGGFAYSPLATFLALDLGAFALPGLRPRPVRTVAMPELGRALTDGALDPPVQALVVWNSNPAVIAPDQNAVLRGLAREDLFTVVLEQFATDTVAYADVVLPATTQLEHLDVVPSWGHHYLTFNEPSIAPIGEAKPNTEAFRLLAARLGLDAPCFRRRDEELIESLLSTYCSIPVDAEALRHRGWWKLDLGQGPTPHADGDFPTPSGRLELRSRRPRRPRPRPSSALRPARRDRRPRPRRPLSPLPAHSEDPPLPQHLVRERPPPTRRPAEPVRRRPSRRRGFARYRRRRRRPRAQRSRLLPRLGRRLRRHPSRRRRLRRWAGGTPTGRAPSPARPPRRNGSRGSHPAPTFNDNRVEIEASTPAGSPRLER